MSGNGFPSPFRIQSSSSGGGAATRVELTVSNDSGGTLTMGTVVFNDANDVVAVPSPTVDALDGTDNSSYPDAVLGVLAEDIADGASGLCVTYGQLDGIDTSAFTVGWTLGTDANGQLTHDYSALYAGFNVCSVVTASVDGSIFVLPGRTNVAMHTHTSDSTAGALERGVQVMIDGGGSPITAGDKLDFELPWNLYLQSVTLLADQSGDIEIDLWSTDFGSFPPTITDSICASALPTLTGAASSQDATITGWSINQAKGNVVRVHVNSAATLTRVALSLKGISW